MDSRYMFALAKDKAFMIKKIFAKGVAELDRQIEKELSETCPQRSIRKDI